LRPLVVTADDAGLHPGMTLGAVTAFDQGIVTAVSLAANGDDFAAAAAALRARPALDAGVHLTLVGERPLSPAREVRSLVGGDGAFLPGFPAFTARYALGRVDPEQVRLELGRQVERARDAGLRVVHVNSHQHLHALPAVFEAVVGLAEEHGIPFVRIPAARAALRRPSVRAAQLAVLDGLGRRAHRRLQERRGAAVCGVRTVALFDAGHLTRESLLRSLADAGPAGPAGKIGDTGGRPEPAELVCHPGLGDAALAARYDWGYGWDAETAALCAPGLRELLRERGFELTSFSGLAS
jgi:predicted glycoside hydrolase/deacetylase ChbG (UPF0249 family)